MVIKTSFKSVQGGALFTEVREFHNAGAEYKKDPSNSAVLDLGTNNESSSEDLSEWLHTCYTSVFKSKFQVYSILLGYLTITT